MDVPILFEALPTRADGPGIETHLDELEPLKGQGLAGINVPEIINGHYHTVDPRTFALSAQRRLGVPAILNRITVHHSGDAFTQWIHETQTLGINSLVLVGGESSSETYPGIHVREALERASPVVDTGVITIPTRRSSQFDEPDRLLAKQDAGASFAISQILMESQAASNLQTDLAAHRKDALRLFWSLAPVRREKDLAFLRWLGVDVPRDVARWLQDAGSNASRARRSHDMNLAIARNLLEDAEVAGSGPIGFCIEHVMAGNIDAAVELVGGVRDVCREFQAIVP